VQQFVLQEHPGLARLVRAQLSGRSALAQRGGRHVKKTRSVLKTNCRDSLDHLQPMWFRSFRSELSRVKNYRRGAQEIQSAYRGIFSETRAGTKGVARDGLCCYHFAGRGVTGRRGAKVAERPLLAGRGTKMLAVMRTLGDINLSDDIYGQARSSGTP
jgi:hypothetical protein